MPWYNDLRPNNEPGKQKYAVVFPDFSVDHKIRTIDNLLALRDQLKDVRSIKRTNTNTLLSSWNIKQLGFLKNRIPDSYYYIAEIISSFDIVALQEIKKGLDDLNIIMKLLGPHWKYIINDITEGNAGNEERFAFVYDSRRISFSRPAGEIVLWEDLFGITNPMQLKRTPYIAGFKTAWKSFALINIHLQPNNDEVSILARKREMELLTDAINAKIAKKNLWTENLVLLGDFNLYDNNQEIVNVLHTHNFFEPDLLEGMKTNTAKTSKAPFDRMFFREGKYFKIPTKATNNSGGVIEIFDTVYKAEDYVHYKEEMRQSK